MEPKYQRTGDRPFRVRGRGGYNPRFRPDHSDPGGTDRGSKEPPRPIGLADTPVLRMFQDFGNLLDAKNDLFEMLVKNSRDTTVESKRIIFLLIRCAAHAHGSVEVHNLLSEAHGRVYQLQNSSLKTIARLLIGHDPHLFNRAFTPGLQEYIECVSLFHYIQNGSLISLSEVQAALNFQENEQSFSLLITPVNYLLGIGDLTGELMRYTVTHSSNAANQAAVLSLCNFAREVLVEFQRVPYGIGKDFGIKLKVMFQSVMKIERVCYHLVLRRAENLPSLPESMIKVEDAPEGAFESAEVF